MDDGCSAQDLVLNFRWVLQVGSNALPVSYNVLIDEVKRIYNALTCRNQDLLNAYLQPSIPNRTEHPNMIDRSIQTHNQGNLWESKSYSPASDKGLALE